MEEDLSMYLSPVHDDFEKQYHAGTYGDYIQKHTQDYFPEVEGSKIAIVAVSDEEGSGSQSAYNVRRNIYNLFVSSVVDYKIIDLGNIMPGENKSSTGFALAKVVEILLKNKIIPVILAKGQEFTYYTYKAYESLEQTINLLTVDNRLDLSPEDEEEVKKNNYLNHIFLHQPNYLLNYTLLAYQTYYVNPLMLKLVNDLNFDSVRLGELKNDLSVAEPYIRNSDFVSFDLSACNSYEAVSATHSGVNGLSSADLISLSRYAGLSDKLTCLGLFEYDPGKDHINNAEIYAQVLWYFFEGIAMRKGDYPIASKKKYIKYSVNLTNIDKEVVFYKSDKTQRWWIEVPYPKTGKSKFERHRLVPCLYEDYLQAQKDEMPSIWLHAYNKI